MAGLFSDLMNLALFGCLLFAMVDRDAPPEDLPWRPLEIAHPPGLATGLKLQRIVAEPERCLAFLEREKVAFTPAADRTQGEFCRVENAVLLGRQNARLSPAQPLMTCRLAAAFAVWSHQVVEPAAREVFGVGVAQIDHYGTYACRRIYGRSEGRISQHALAEAVDVAAFRLTDGRRVSVLSAWDDEAEAGTFLRRVRDQGCRLFRAALSPDYNVAHANHLHFDMGPFSLCR